MTGKPARILYCHCAYAQVVPKEVKEAVLRALAGSGVAFDAVPDLCELSARGDASLARLADTAGGDVKIAACYPRAVKWLFAAAGVTMPEQGVEVLNMRTDSAEQVVFALLGDRLAGAGATAPVETAAAAVAAEGAPS
jgi:hypothetical protein